MTSRIN